MKTTTFEIYTTELEYYEKAADLMAAQFYAESGGESKTIITIGYPTEDSLRILFFQAGVYNALADVKKIISPTLERQEPNY